MNKVFKKGVIILLLLLTATIGFTINNNEVNALTIEEWEYPVEWSLVGYFEDPVLFYLTNTNPTLYTYGQVCQPFVEIQYIALKGYDSNSQNTYIALLANISMSPNSASQYAYDGYCRADSVKLTTNTYAGTLVEGSPTATSGETIVTTSGGADISIGTSGITASAAVESTFQTVVNDLEIYGYRQRINESDSVTRQYTVLYDYVNPSNSSYYTSTSQLKYLAIYKMSSSQTTYYFNSSLYADIVLYHPSNCNYYKVYGTQNKTLKVMLSYNSVHFTVC